jgi:hypothetical protein
MIEHHVRKAIRSDPTSRDESLVADPRDRLSPAQMVETKLLSLLKTSAVPMSYMLARSQLVGGRSR